ncbi:MAG: hypothetical protein VCA34_07050 [Roseibacillus sp.]
MKLLLLALAKPLLPLVGFVVFGVAYRSDQAAAPPDFQFDAPAVERVPEKPPPAVDLPPLKQEDQETKPEKE